MTQRNKLKVVAAWISKARKFLKARKDVLDLAGNM